MIQLYLQLLDTEKEKADFELLYERYRRLMHWVAKEILHDNELAEDAVHEAFLRVIKNFHKIHEISCPQTRNFVVIIVRNVAISMRAKEKKQTHKFAASEPEDAEHGLKHSSAASDVISENDGLDWESITNGIDETTAALLAALVACGVRWVIIWNETQNDEQGTLDITFDIEGEKDSSQEFEIKRPKTPQGFEIIREFEEGNICEIVYQEIDNNVQILYSQSGNAEYTAISIDNDDDSFEAIQINGYRGYCVSEKEYCLIVWTDGISVFSVSSNADFETTYKVAESVS